MRPYGPHTLSLHDALPIWRQPQDRAQDRGGVAVAVEVQPARPQRSGGKRSVSPHRPTRRRPLRHTLDEGRGPRSEEHTSELQSPCKLVCCLLLEKKKNMNT